MTTTGIQARLAVDGTSHCPVVDAAADADGTARSIDWSVAQDDGTVVEEFTLESDDDDVGIEESLSADAEVVFDVDGTQRYRFVREQSEPCICDRIERHGCPVSDVEAVDGDLHVSFYATDVETIRTVLGDLNEAYPSVRIERLARTNDDDDSDFVLIDRGQLTDRQREVLETAMAMGYFERPRESNATEVADELDISLSTFAEHLAAAQSKLVGSLFETPA